MIVQVNIPKDKMTPTVEALVELMYQMVLAVDVWHDDKGMWFELVPPATLPPPTVAESKDWAEKTMAMLKALGLNATTE